MAAAVAGEEEVDMPGVDGQGSRKVGTTGSFSALYAGAMVRSGI